MAVSSIQQCIMTIHAEEEMAADNLTIFDIERGILSGKIIERQQDRIQGEWKYLIKGQTMSEQEVVIVTKLSLTGKLVIITVYAE